MRAWALRRVVLLVAILVGGAPAAATAGGDAVETSGRPLHAYPVHPSPRRLESLAYDRSTRSVVLFGGISPFGEETSQVFPDDTWTWDGTGWTLEHPAHSPPPREDAGMAYDAARGVVVMFGGEAWDEFADTWTWDGADWTLQHPLHSPPKRTAMGMAYDDALGEVILFGGVGGVNESDLNDTWAWDGQDWTQLQPGDSPSRRQEVAMTYDAARRQVVLFGGQYSQALNETWTFDGATWTKEAPSRSPPVRTLGAMAFDSARARVVLFGGYNGAGGPLHDTWTWNGRNWRDAQPGDSPPGMMLDGMAFDEVDGTTIIFGGYSDLCGTLGDTWVWDGATWSEVDPPHAPPVKRGSRMVYDPTSGDMLLVGTTRCRTTDTWAWNGSGWNRLRPSRDPPGGDDPGLALDEATGRVVYFDDGPTWTWDGTTWSSGPSLPGRVGAPAASDPASGHVMLFGGGYLQSCGFNVYCYPSYAETWEWNGRRWVREHPITSPPARYLEGLAAGPGGTVVLFGGRADMCGVGECDQLFGDTWTWDGSNWTLRHPLHAPPGGYGVAMTYDEAQGVDVLFGGSGGAGTWTWDGHDWTELHPATTPPPMVDAAMAYDPVHQQVVLYRGAGDDDTWTWDGTNWTRHRQT